MEGREGVPNPNLEADAVADVGVEVDQPVLVRLQDCQLRQSS